MKDKEVIEKYMVPFLMKYGFSITKATKDLLQLQDNKNSQIIISISIQRLGGAVCTELRRGRNDLLPSYPLTIFLDEPENMNPINRDNYWYYDTEKELVGALEEQANILLKQGFSWLRGTTDVDIDKILKEKAEENARRYENLSTNEKDELIKKTSEVFNRWRKRRVQPNEWR